MKDKKLTPYKALIMALRRSRASENIVASEILYELQQLGYMNPEGLTKKGE